MWFSTRATWTTSPELKKEKVRENGVVSRRTLSGGPQREGRLRAESLAPGHE